MKGASVLDYDQQRSLPYAFGVVAKRREEPPYRPSQHQRLHPQPLVRDPERASLAIHQRNHQIHYHDSGRQDKHPHSRHRW